MGAPSDATGLLGGASRWRSGQHNDPPGKPVVFCSILAVVHSGQRNGSTGQAGGIVGVLPFETLTPMVPIAKILLDLRPQLASLIASQ
jgi:hypothetical protein